MRNCLSLTPVQHNLCRAPIFQQLSSRTRKSSAAQGDTCHQTAQRRFQAKRAYQAGDATAANSTAPSMSMLEASDRGLIDRLHTSAN